MITKTVLAILLASAAAVAHAQAPTPPVAGNIDEKSVKYGVHGFDYKDMTAPDKTALCIKKGGTAYRTNKVLVTKPNGNVVYAAGCRDKDDKEI